MNAVKVKFASDSCESGWIYLDYEEPAKTLTDEEIMLVSDEFKGLPVTSVEAWNKVILLFARAILRKAQEK